MPRRRLRRRRHQRQSSGRKHRRRRRQLWQPQWQQQPNRLGRLLPCQLLRLPLHQRCRRKRRQGSRRPRPAALAQLCEGVTIEFSHCSTAFTGFCMSCVATNLQQLPRVFLGSMLYYKDRRCAITIMGLPCNTEASVAGQQLQNSLTMQTCTCCSANANATAGLRHFCTLLCPPAVLPLLRLPACQRPGQASAAGGE